MRARSTLPRRPSAAREPRPRPRASLPARDRDAGRLQAPVRDSRGRQGGTREPIGGTLEKLLAERGWTAPVAVGSVVGRWREVVGDEIADHAEPETFTDGKLVVRTTSTAWATQLRLLLPQLDRRLAQEVGEGVVEEIVVLGPGAPSWVKGPRVVRGRGPRDTYG